MFMNLVLVGMLADKNAASHEAMITVGYFLSGFAILVTIGILIMAIKL